ncbi:MAG: TetR/AcrR family transcriptional regulator [Cyclobacteriaceae bacterium]
MRPQKVEDQELLTALMAVLRTKGYAGASLNELASGSGLQKASLYYRYPGGKQDIGKAVLSFVSEWLKMNVQDVLMNKNKPADDRLNVALKNIDELYHGGKKACILRALSIGEGLHLFAEEIGLSMDLLLKAFTELGLDIGMDPYKAKETAMQVLISIQGSLVVARTLDDTSPFTNTLVRIRKMYYP